jgi:hypothetical protein
VGCMRPRSDAVIGRSGPSSLLRPLRRQRLHQPRQRHPLRLPPLDDRLDDVPPFGRCLRPGGAGRMTLREPRDRFADSCTTSWAPRAVCGCTSPVPAVSVLQAAPRGRLDTAARGVAPVLWGWRHPPEGHRAGSRPRVAREREQLSRSSEPSVRRLLAARGPECDGRLHR